MYVYIHMCKYVYVIDNAYAKRNEWKQFFFLIANGRIDILKK